MDDAPSQGKRIEGRYELTEQLSEGAYGLIWVAKDSKFQGRQVAVKFLKTVFDKDDDAARRFDKEANALGILQHPNVVVVIDRGRWNDRPYIVMEYIDGTPLDEWIQRHRDNGTLPEFATVRGIFDQVCRGVAAAHAVRSPGAIVHRDLKPANVMIIEGQSGDCIVKVLDFGIAQLGARDGTLPGVRFGTPDYMAPEQVSGQVGKVSPATDVFALGVILFEMLTLKWYAGDEERWHYASTTRSSQLEKLMSGTRPGVPGAVWRVIAQAMHADGKSRFEDAGALRSALDAAWKKSASPRPLALALGLLAALASVSTLAIWKYDHARVSSSRQTPRDRASSDAAVRGRPGANPDISPGVNPGVSSDVSSDVSLGASPGVSPDVSPPALLLGCPEGMLRLPAGSFQMGSAAGVGEPDERPAHRVTLRAFCMDRTEVTAGQYALCVSGGRCPAAPTEVHWANITARDRGLYSRFCNAGHPDRVNHPMNCVGYSESEAFCRAQGARLPTEAEWEYAARGAGGRVYPWGNTAPTNVLLNGCGTECARLGQSLGESWQTMYPADDGWAGTAPVGSFPRGASAEGVMDLAGNVAERTSDYYAPYPAGEISDPRGPSEGDHRVSRGGGWNFGEGQWVRASARDSVAPEFRDRYLGMRCARDLGR